MKTIEEIREKFKNYEVKSEYEIFRSSLKEFQTYIKCSILDAEQQIIECTSEIHANNKSKIIETIKSIFLLLEADTELMDEDNKILFEELQESYIQKDYFETMKHIVAEENYKELAKVASFAIDEYNIFIERAEALREVIDMRAQGYNVYNSLCNLKEDNREVVHEFLLEKLSELTPVKGIEKVKKI